MTREQKRYRDREAAEKARDQWEQAIREGREHYFINSKWESYRAMAGRDFDDIEHAAALRDRANR